MVSETERSVETSEAGIEVMELPTSSNTSACGCKGVRFCALCKDSERIRNLNLNEVPEDEQFHDFKRYLFCSTCNQAFPSTEIDTASLTDYKFFESVAENFHDHHTEKQSCPLDLEGILLIPDFISEKEEADLVTDIDKKAWALSQSGRRKQDYGPKVNFKKHKVRVDTFAGLPEYADSLLEKMSQCPELSDYLPLELCNLEYDPTRESNIQFHIDDTWIWGNRLISLNLISGSIMTLQQENEKLLLLVPMPRRSILCMFGRARYEWKHGIMREHIRTRRIALTMREMAPAFKEGGELFEKMGSALLERGKIRLPADAS